MKVRVSPTALLFVFVVFFFLLLNKN